MLMETIKTEANRNSKRSLDLDFFRSRYIETDPETLFSITYPAHEIYSYAHNYFVLLSKADYVEFKTSWEMRPDYTSYDMYGDVIFWPLILFVNDIYSIEDYRNLEGVYIPPYSLVLKIVKDRVPKHHVDPVHIYRDIPGINVFDKAPLDTYEIENIIAKDNLDTASEEDETTEPVLVLKEVTETFTLTESNIENKMITLRKTPVNASTVSLYIGSMNVPQKYGYHYVLTKNSTYNDYRDISWDASDVFNQVGGMDAILEEAMTIRVKYLYEEYE